MRGRRRFSRGRGKRRSFTRRGKAGRRRRVSGMRIGYRF